MADRDFVVRQTRMQLPCGTYVVHTVSSAAHEAEAASVVEGHRRRGCVRAVLGDCGWVVRPVDSHSCHVTYVAQVDPKARVGVDWCVLLSLDDRAPSQHGWSTSLHPACPWPSRECGRWRSSARHRLRPMQYA